MSYEDDIECVSDAESCVQNNSRVIESEDEINVATDSDDVRDYVKDDKNGDERQQNLETQNPRPFTNFCIENILNSDFGKYELRQQYLRTCQEHYDVTRFLYPSKYVSSDELKQYNVDYRTFFGLRDDSKIDDVRLNDIAKNPHTNGYNDVIKHPHLKNTNDKYSTKSKNNDNESRTALDLSRKPNRPSEHKNERVEKGAQEPVTSETTSDDNKVIWPAWVFCTRYSDRPSSGPRIRKPKARSKCAVEKRPRTAFSKSQLDRLKVAFDGNQYLNEPSRITLSEELHLSQSQIKIWFQNKRAKLKKSSGCSNTLASELRAQGLYNHSTLGDK